MPMFRKEQRVPRDVEKILQLKLLIQGNRIMLQDPGHATPPSKRSSTLMPHDLKILAVFALAVSALLLFAASKIEMPGDPEYSTTVYALYR